MPYDPVTRIRLDGAHSDNIWSACWTVQNRVLTGGLDGTVKIFSVKEDYSEIKCEGISNKQKMGVTSIDIVGDGSIAIVAYQDSVIRLFSTDNMVEISTIKPGLLESYQVSISLQDDLIASGNHLGCVNLWSMQQGHERVSKLDANCKAILATKFSPTNQIGSGSSDGIVAIFDVESGKATHKIYEHAMCIRSIQFSPVDGNLVYAACDDRTVSVFDQTSGKIFKQFSFPSMARCVDVSQDRRHFIVGCSDGSVSVYDIGMQAKVKSFDAHKDQVWDCKFDKFSPASKFVSVGDDAMIQVYS